MLNAHANGELSRRHCNALFIERNERIAGRMPKSKNCGFYGQFALFPAD